MLDSDLKQFSVMIESLSEIYPDKKQLSPAALKLWFDSLKRFDIQDISKALTIHINDPEAGVYFPKPADVVRNIEGSKVDRSALAWSKVDKAIRQVGPYKSVCFDSEITNRVISDMGGWVQLCKVTDDEFPFRENEFKKRFQSFVLSPPKEFPTHLAGLSEIQNGGNKLKIEPPVLIGNPENAEKVFEKGGDMMLQIKQLGENELKQITRAVA